MNVLNAVAVERDLLVERTQAGLSRAKARETVSALAREFKTSRQTIMRMRDAMSDPRLV